ncbi:MAG: serine/threonine protein kinase [Deltaproteobacteria bacterium]|nr:MAG: serine/threonine protein kinase [Deltaproteobacteria bacterium]
MKRRSLWQRLIDWAQGAGDDAAGALPAAPATPPPAPVHEADAWLSELVAAAADGRRRDEIGGDAFWDAVDRLRASGHERLAIQWLDKLLAAQATPDTARTALRARLAEWLVDRGDTAAAVPHLEQLARDDAHAARAHYLLGEHYRRVGDEVRALRHYEAVLARDVTYPNVRQRVDRLRAARGAPMAALGATIAGPDALGGAAGARYHLVRELGRGATGVVYLARDRDLERDVAVKLLHPHLAAGPQSVACARFFAEARIAASLRHPNIVAILDLDEPARRIVMEWAAGGTLRDVLRDRGPRPVRRALERHVQLLSALAAAHRRGIVHADIKPGNLMFRRDADEPGAEIVLGDFGIAHLPHPARSGDRPAVAAEGTLAYMAPEQRGGRTRPESDVFAAAVVLYEMLTGRVPGAPGAVLAGRRTADDFAVPREVARDWPPGLADAVDDHLRRLGAPTPDDRPDAAGALAEARDLWRLCVRAGPRPSAAA